MQDLKHFRVERNENGVTEVILSRPKKLNSMTPLFFDECKTIFDTLDKDEKTNVVLIWAEGKMFTAGLDLQSASSLFTKNYGSQATTASVFLEAVRRWQSAFTAIAKCKKPVISAVHNYCIGGGIDLITACDIRLCSADAKFSVRETQIAITADLGTLQRLTKIIGKGYAMEMSLTGSDYTSVHVSKFGLVNNVFETKEELLKEARRMASIISSNSPLVVQATKHILDYSSEHSVAEGLEYVALWNSAFLRSEDLNEAIMSFMQKKTPKFKNRL
eukprot:gene3130-5446_t